MKCDDAEALDRPMNRGIASSAIDVSSTHYNTRHMLIIIRGICAEDPAQMRFTEHDHVVQAFPPD